MKTQIKAKKHFGQNFLSDQNIIKKIINIFNLHNQNIVEIGPGMGALTKELIKVATSVHCFEVDKDMIAILNKIFDNQQNLHIYHQDFLKADLTNLKQSYLIANIPYYITTDILFKIFENKNKFSKMLLMVQKEVAQRIVAAKNSQDYSKLSISCQYLADVKIEFIVKANSFIPAPKVDSAIVSFVFKKNISLENWFEIKDFFKLVFGYRRKKLIFSLLKKYHINKINNVFKQLSLSENIRIQQLDVETIVQMFWLLNN
ncbi:16S rRNA (adenine(1518)-N(6)/adenine(1519)-N(6))-dimethyltransferase RsmA [Mycoplasmopsis cricetuli]|uniref:16S rRNA (adenine(1518)-N(6)/adenine(1519)-N(6))- dimethyltransferase RsmA n=1 Tax=Mycoplasmopsis cricetuli TaxID=171283 RepID=UPI00046F2F5B|nr:16S rRNA (adenine(1518)-N(6)/adenine(1519)-N(6))-dimethyltransferase RsmA [Mycoplasmopsis cricetuli]